MEQERQKRLRATPLKLCPGLPARSAAISRHGSGGSRPGGGVRSRPVCPPPPPPAWRGLVGNGPGGGGGDVPRGKLGGSVEKRNFSGGGGSRALGLRVSVPSVSAAGGFRGWGSTRSCAMVAGRSDTRPRCSATPRATRSSRYTRNCSAHGSSRFSPRCTPAVPAPPRCSPPWGIPLYSTPVSPPRGSGVPAPSSSIFPSVLRGATRPPPTSRSRFLWQHPRSRCPRFVTGRTPQAATPPCPPTSPNGTH